MKFYTSFINTNNNSYLAEFENIVSYSYYKFTFTTNAGGIVSIGEIQCFVKQITTPSTYPSSPIESQIVFDTEELKLKVFYNGSWV